MARLQPLELVHYFLHAYAEERSLASILACLSADVCWIGTGGQEPVISCASCAELLRQELEREPEPFAYRLANVCTVSGGQGSVCFSGKLLFSQDEVKSKRERICRFSCVCRQEDEGWRICFLHFSLEAEQAGRSVQAAASLENSSFEEPSYLVPSEPATVNLSGGLLSDLTAHARTVALEFIKESMPTGILIAYPDEGMTLYQANELFLTMIGYRDLHEFTSACGGLFRACVHPEDLPKLERALRISVQTDKPANVEYRIRKKDKSFLWVRERVRQVLLSNTLFLFVGCIVDITERRRLEASLELNHSMLKRKNDELEELCQSVFSGIAKIVADSHSYKLLFANNQFFEQLGYTREQFLSERGNKVRKLVYPEDVFLLNEVVRTDPGEKFSCQFRVQHRDGHFFWVRMEGKVSSKQYTGSPVVYCFFTNIEGQREQEALYRRQQFFTSLVFSSITGGSVVTMGPLRYPVYTSESLADVLGETPHTFKERLKGSLYNLVYAEDRKRVEAQFSQQVASNPDGVYELEYRVRRRDGVLRWILEKGRHTLNAQGKDIYIAILLDISERREKMNELVRRTQIDPLTGLYNREYSVQYIRTYLDIHGNDHASALLVFDLDNFKYINDSRGHLEGDNVLRKVGELLKKQFHSRDLVGRIGGDEFIAFLQDVPSEAVAQNRAQEIQRLFEQKMNESCTGCRITISVGVGYAAGRVVQFAELFQMADRAMYRNKNKADRENFSRMSFSASTGMIEFRGVRASNPARRERLIHEVVAEVPLGATAELYEVNLTRNSYTSLCRIEDFFPDLPVQGTAEGMLGYLMSVSLHPDDLEAYQKFLLIESPEQRYSLDRETSYAEFRYRLADGNYHWLSTTLLPARNEAGDLLIFSLVVNVDDRR